MDTYAGTTCRSGQRLVDAVAAENADFVLFSFDVSQAFAKALAFEDFSVLTGQPIRKVELDVPKVGFDCLRQLPDFNDFDPKYETLTMLRPIYGLEDAPRVWMKTLHEVLAGWMSYRQLYNEFELYCIHKEEDAGGVRICWREQIGTMRNSRKQGSGRSLHRSSKGQPPVLAWCPR